MSGTRVTAEDLVSGESESVEIKDNYVLICDGSCHVTSTQLHAGGTVVITLKGIR